MNTEQLVLTSHDQTLAELASAPTVFEKNTRRLWPRIGMLAVLSLSAVGLAGCGSTASTEEAATTALRLLDVSSSASGKISRTSESFWRVPGSNRILRCSHSQDTGTNNTMGPHDCNSFGVPTQLPENAKLLAMNMGVGEKTQTIWDTAPEGGLMICNHDTAGVFDTKTADANHCQQFGLPVDIKPGANLASFNSGSGQDAQTFWNNPNGTITACTHEKVLDGFLGTGGNGIGPEQPNQCYAFVVDYSKFPEGVKNPILRGVTSDSGRNAETFWQDVNGRLVRCEDSKDSQGILANSRVGGINSCEYWEAPQAPTLTK